MLKPSPPPRFDEGAHAYVLGWLSDFGHTLAKGRRQSVDVLADGRTRLVIYYPSLGEVLLAMQEIDALIAMAREHEGATEGDAMAASSRRSLRPQARQ
jgi:hypothetical protein